MLARFEVENFRSILDPVELSMVAAEDARVEVFPSRENGVSLLPLAAIYGPNASGKTNVVAALDWLLTGIRDSLRFWDDGIPSEPFGLPAERIDRPTSFSIEHMIDGVHYDYHVEVDAEAVRYEALFRVRESRRLPLFEREGLSLEMAADFSASRGTRDLLTKRSLVLSIVRRFEDPLLVDYVQELLRGRSLGFPRAGRKFRTPRETGHSVFGIDLALRNARHTETRERAVEMLRLADFGVEDVILDEETDAIQLLHRVGDSLAPLDFELESRGTRTWFELIVPVLDALETGSLLLFDELDASLHPTLSAALLRLFQDHRSNPLGAQLVFTSHDTSLLDHLNRDEVWLTEKSRSAATSLVALAEFSGNRVQESRDLERGYLAGRFGALPDIDRWALLRALGLSG